MHHFEQDLDPDLYPQQHYPDYKLDENEQFREPIAKLGKKITDRVPQKLGLKKITKDDPEYWGLGAVVTDEEAEIALKMGVRQPKTFQDMKNLTGLDDKKLQDLLDSMSQKGLIEYNWENETRTKQWVLPMFVPGCAEFMNMNPDILDQHPEIGVFFENMSRLPLEDITPFVPEGGSGIGMHVIPVEKSIELINNTEDIEHISHWLDKYDGKYAASPCSCRKSRLTHGQGCGDDPEGWCIAVGDMADYVVETNKGGRYITRDEVLQILQQAEDNGFVHQITNIDGKNKIFAICNCNVNVCYALRTSQLFNTPNMSRSAFTAIVDKTKCVACGKCVESCPSGAVKLGQKLCTAQGGIVEYPQMPLPGKDIKWGPHMWTHNYRDINRINCYDTGTSPCKTACPAHIAIQGYLQLAKEGKYKEALELIKKDNPLPAICGRICNKPCEDACTRGLIDDPVAIDDVKRFIAEQDLKSNARYIPNPIIPSLNGPFKQKVAVIGSGPSGLSCAYFLCLKGYKPTVFEKNEKAGGMLTYGVPNFKLENELIQSEVDVIKQMGAEFIYGTEVGKDVSIADLRSQGYKAFFIGIGAQGGKVPNIEGTEASGVTNAVEFLRETSVKEASELAGNIAVIGGGNVAVDVARTARRCANGKITMFSLEDAGEMPASDSEIKEAELEDIQIQNGWGPNKILTKDGKVCGIELIKCVSVFDKDNKFNPKYDDNNKIKVECDHVIFSIGQAVELGGIFDNEDVDCLPNGYIIADKLTRQTSVSDIFTGGDIYNGPSFAIDAVASGREAAESIHRYVQGPETCTLTIGRNRRNYVEIDKQNIGFGNYSDTPRQTTPFARSYKGDDVSIENQAGSVYTIDQMKKSFRDCSQTLSEKQVKDEAERCLACGASHVDPNKCIGCGVCTTKCAFDAISLVRDHPDASTMVPSEEKLKYILPAMLKDKIKIRFSNKKQ